MKHKCSKHALYWEDEESRGTFCSICNKIIDIELYPINNLVKGDNDVNKQPK